MRSFGWLFTALLSVGVFYGSAAYAVSVDETDLSGDPFFEDFPDALFTAVPRYQVPTLEVGANFISGGISGFCFADTFFINCLEDFSNDIDSVAITVAPGTQVTNINLIIGDIEAPNDFEGILEVTAVSDDDLVYADFFTPNFSSIFNSGLPLGPGEYDIDIYGSEILTDFDDDLEPDVLQSLFDEILELDGDSYTVPYEIEIEVVRRPNEIPLPAGVWLFGSALVGFTGLRRKRRGAA
ncbi:MAG: VPLPA-CTERM sorting domain-containing protein [Pseudomonadota bacterium]